MTLPTDTEGDKDAQSDLTDLVQLQSNANRGTTTGRRSREQIIRETTENYLRRVATSGHGSLPTPEELEPKLLAAIEAEIFLANMTYKSETGVTKDRLFRPTSLPSLAIALSMLCLFRIVVIRPSAVSEGEARERGMLARYEESGPDAGLYVGRPEYMRALVRRFHSEISKDMANIVLALVRSHAEVVSPSDNRDSIAVNNGIFDFDTKALTPFSPEHVFLSKVRTDYDQHATVSPSIKNPDGTKWEIEQWAIELFDDQELTDLLWEVLSASVRPLVRWDKAVYPFDEDGENGKGTFLVLVRNLVGNGSWVSLPIADFAKNFQLAQIVNNHLVATDENDVGSFSERLANYKAVVTGDVITIEEKYERPYSYVPQVFVIQCLNSFPKAKDTSRSHYRRQLFWPFSKSFTGKANPLIKEDYLRRPDVLEYVLHRVLHADPFYKLSNPLASQKVLGDFKNVNDPVRACWEDLNEQFIWDLLPTAFLYDLYVAWTERFSPNGKAVSLGEFGRRIAAIARESADWVQGSHRTGTRMVAPEPLIARFDLRDWMNPSYTGEDPDKKSRPFPLGERYRGLLRATAVVAGDSDDDTTAAAGTGEDS